MTYVKRLVMHGFKSFVKKTEIPFTPEINVILGPNGSGKSNVMDALCFVLGRLSIKSMRAAKAKNLIFMGSKIAGPAKEATVEIVFDNSDKTFSIDSSEISIIRTVRKNGQSLYKINNHLKTRQEVLALLAQGGIDPHGFNLILQGEIQNLVRMHNEERRKIIEEVSGISIYELRKQKSIKELDKTEEKLKEINAILKERTAYLNNLEKERQQALRYKKLEKDIRALKASILSYDLNKNKKLSTNIFDEIQKKNSEIEKVKKTIVTLEAEYNNLEAKIVSINSIIQKSTGLEQEKLNREITNIRAELAGLVVNIENNQRKLSQTAKQKKELDISIEENENKINSIKQGLGKDISKYKNKKSEVEFKQRHLDELEEQRKALYMRKSELKSVKEKIEEKQISSNSYMSELDFLSKQIQSIARELFDKQTSENKINSLRVSLAEKKQLLDNLREKEIQLEKISYNNEYEIDRQNKLIEKIAGMDICPLCKSKITEGHIHSITKEIEPQLDELNSQVQRSDKELGEIYNRKKILDQNIENLIREIANRESDMLKLSSIEEKEKQIKSLQEKIKIMGSELIALKNNKSELEKRIESNSDVEHKYEKLRLELQEISVIDEEDTDSEILFRKRELERSKINLKQLLRDEKEISEELQTLLKSQKEKQILLEKKNKLEQELSEKFRKFISQREELTKKIRDYEIEVSRKKNVIYNLEQEINNFKIEKARLDATIENLSSELSNFSGVEIIPGKKEVLVDKLSNAQEIFSRLGSVNLRSLEVYDSIKKEYDSVKEKVETIEKEKNGIMKIIHEIDIKKKKTFLTTLNSLNEIFSRNFSQLSTKGQVYLELENKKDPFEGGVTIIVKTGHGKYFDVTSLSGGEQTIVALSLIFGIQELNPYAFYVLDEIDAALDKRNSERLAGLLKKYMEKGQYIVISHNDEIITNASNLYGISMHDGISKVISLKV